MTTTTSLSSYLDINLIEVQSNISSRKKLLEKMAHLLAKPLLLADDASQSPSHQLRQKPKSKLNTLARKSSDNEAHSFSEKDIYHLLLEREKLGNTGVGNGVALPHGRCEYADKAIVGIIVLSDPVDFDSIDGQGVDVAFGLLVPQNAAQEHLNLLKSIASLMSNQDYKERLAAAHSAQQVIDYLNDWSRSPS